MQSAQRKRLEQEEHSAIPGVTSRSAGDWFVEPGARTPDTLPDPLAIDPIVEQVARIDLPLD